ncbi:hypothetical protein [Acinetobacter soli]|uniref:hypothetical protein n=1 Tax=Acinetobacter soli TaxID=487316 RepID=UPI001D0A1D0C|nr:hypothetical protein [Acinetobacter soli]MCB8769551.1 hypothetical protein [Acinetobacter soli]
MNEIKQTLQQDADALLKRLQQSRKNGTGVTLSVGDVGVLCEEIDSLKAQLRELNDTVQHLKTESSGVHAALRDQQSTNEDLLEKLFGVDAGEYVVVPKEPTEAMIKHAYGTYEGATILPYGFYKAMIEAAQENSYE